MKQSARSAVIVGIMLVALLPAGAARASPATAQVKLGYSPTSLGAVSQGSPVYTAGDELWLMSEYNESVYVNLVPPNSSFSVASQPVSSRTAVLLYTFSTADPPGVWVLGVSASNSTLASVPFSLVQLSALAAPSVARSSIEPNGTLSLTLVTSLGDESDAQGCLVGSANPDLVTVPFPKGAGHGTVSIAYNGLSMSLASSGARSSFDFWAELYYSYSYTSPSDPRQLVARSVLAAATQPVAIGGESPPNETMPLDSFVQLRTGRYDLRAFARDATGLSVYETTVALEKGRPWLWLGGCIDLVSMQTTTFAGSPLPRNPSSWPRGIYSMAYVQGVEGISYSPLPLNLSRVSLVTVPWGTPVPAAMSTAVFAPQDGSSCLAYNSTVYCVLRAVPAGLVLAFGYRGIALQNSSLTVGSEYYSGPLTVPLGKLLVKGESGGTPASGAPVSVSGQAVGGLTVENRSTGPDGSTTFLLLGGNYTVAFRYGAYDTSVEVRVTPGGVSEVDVAVPEAMPTGYAYTLLALAAVGVVFDLWAWRGSGVRKR